MIFPLNTLTLNKIKSSIKDLSTTFQTNTIPIREIGTIPGGRRLVEASSWPIDAALKFLEQEGAIKVTGDNLEILNNQYFDINSTGANLPTMNKPTVFQTTFTSYKRTEIIGEGGSGRVYKALDEEGHVYAIKLLNSAKTSNTKTKRFKNEILFSQKSKHQNIITVIDHGIYMDGQSSAPFYVMPFYKTSLRGLIESGIPSEKIMFYYSQLLDGVEAAHLQHVFHRDLKPENILYDETQDKMVIADFGIAHFEEEELYTDVETSPHERLANFQYAAPEQRTRNVKVDHRADIYALGLILNEMFTRIVPHGTGYKTIDSVASEFGYLDELVSQMLHQSPQYRPETIEKLKQQLIGRKHEFVALQKLNELKQTVIRVTDIDDPLISDPPRLVNFDYNKNLLTLIFQRPVSPKWVQSLYNMGTYTSLLGKGPEHFSFSGDKASISARESEVQPIINYFKEWIPNANRVYEETVRREKQQAEERQRRQLQAEVEEQERRKRILSTVKI